MNEITNTTAAILSTAEARVVIDDLDRRIAAAQDPIEELGLYRERLAAIEATGRTAESHGNAGLVWDIHAELTRRNIRRLERRIAA